MRLFRLNDGRGEIGYAFAEVIDFAAIEDEVIQAEVPGEISGVSLINGEPAEMVDAHWLFAKHVGAAASSADPLVCRLPSDDPWMQNMLRPIVEAAGYRVVADGDDEEADLVIAAQGSEVSDPAKRTIWLRAEPEAAGKKDDSIYRYDRAGPADGTQIRNRRKPMSMLLLVVTIAGERVALPADAVEAVVELDTLIPVPRAAPHVAGLSALRSRVLTVIDCMRSLELGVTDCSDGIREAAVVELDGHHYALIVDHGRGRGRGPVRPAPVRAAMGPGWERVVAGHGRNRDRAAAAGRCRGAGRRPRSQGSLRSSLPLSFIQLAQSKAGSRKAMKSCLIVDDCKVIRKVARHILETLEFEVEEAGDGQEALTAAKPRCPTSSCSTGTCR